MKPIKGQTSFEFLVLLGFMLIVFATFFLLMQQFVISGNERQVRDALIVIAHGVRDEILTANQVHTGYSREFTIPQEVLGQEYEIEIVGDELLAITRDPVYFEYLVFLPFVVEIENIGGVGGNNLLNNYPHKNVIRSFMGENITITPISAS